MGWAGVAAGMILLAFAEQEHLLQPSLDRGGKCH